MRRLTAHAFETAAGAKPWSPVSNTGSVAVGTQSPQNEGYRQGYLEGFEAGFADGDKEARQALEMAQENAHAAKEAAEAEKERWQSGLVQLTEQFAAVQKVEREQSEALAVTIAYAAVCRLVGLMYAERSLVAGLCREALENMQVEPVQIRVTQTDHASLEKVGLALPIKADPTLQSGDCIIETPLGGIEAGIEIQLRALLKALLEALGRKEPQP